MLPFHIWWFSPFIVTTNFGDKHVVFLHGTVKETESEMLSHPSKITAEDQDDVP